MKSNKQTLLFAISLTSLCIFFNLIDSASDYTPLENISLTCGYDGDSVTDNNGRKWSGDNPSSFIPSPQRLNASSTSTASTQDSGVPQIPYMSARIFHSQFTYAFPVSAGPKFVRLHFHAASYSGLNISNSFFTVTANDRYTLLHNFSASLTSRFLGVAYFLREFTVNIAPPNRSLKVTFLPNSNSFGFVNGIEVVSMPTNLYIRGPDNYIPIVGQNQQLPIDNSTALAMLYRLNVAGQAISSIDDTGMFRDWAPDNDYIFGSIGADPYHATIQIKYTKVPPYTAPELLYRTARSMGDNASVNANYNLTWLFPVDMGFYYLVRLHFCEISSRITAINRRVFQIFLNNQTADAEMDIVEYAGGNGVPIYRDFIVMVPQGSGVMQDLWLALHPNTRAEPQYIDALLNGVEIFKLNNSDGSLAGLNPDPTDEPDSNQQKPLIPKKTDRQNKSRTVIIVAVLLGGAAVLSIPVLFVVIRRRRGNDAESSSGISWWDSNSKSGSESKTNGYLPSDLCHQFSLAEIKSATDDFSDALLIGVGGFGNVYRGHITDISGADTPAAIKRLNPTSRQGAHEFCTEIHMLSRLRHVNLVSLIGYCVDQGEMILVYDYMARGSLREHLYGSDKPPLSWKQRLAVCIGAARGLHYLHSGTKHMIIHRDVKTTNILLDEKWVAKVSDFGLSRLGPSGASQSHVSTVVKGSFGYLDPEYYKRQQLTEKSDVYSFGVVLLEALCGRAPLKRNAAEKVEECLSEWGRSHYQNGTLDQIVDAELKGEIAPECLKMIGEIANSCLLDRGIQRPGMDEVVWKLEFALQLQENAEERREEEGDWARLDTCEEMGPAVDWNGFNSRVAMSGDVFSDIRSPKGR